MPEAFRGGGCFKKGVYKKYISVLGFYKRRILLEVKIMM